jgi:FtsH-binding integral membrane protein
MSTHSEHKQNSEQDPQQEQPDKHNKHDKHERRMYLRFAAMILTAMVVMYWVMFAGTWEWGHVQFSQSRVFMTLTMGGTMGLIMLAWMLNMYKNATLNLVIIGVSLVLLAGGIFLDRSQTTVQDKAFMRGMIPHHSLAITRSERSELVDVRVCQLAVEISEAQRREILEMEWLIDDITQNGEALTPEEAQARPVPDFDRPALRTCPTP